MCEDLNKERTTREALFLLSVADSQLRYRGPSPAAPERRYAVLRVLRTTAGIGGKSSVYIHLKW